jgi:hypothetical protein
MKLTGEHRYRQAVTLARRVSRREVDDLIAGRISGTEMCGMDRERYHLIRELDRAYEAGFTAGRAALEQEGK